MKTAINEVRSTLRWLVGLLLVACAVLPVAAQGFPPAAAPAWVYADNYGRWAIALQNTGTYTFSPPSACTVTQVGFNLLSSFYAFADNVALAPVLIQDQNQANSEVVTPSSYLAPTSTTCGINVSPANTHYAGATLQSGTGGLQEALNALATSSAGQFYTVVLSPEWYKLVNNIAAQNATLPASVSPASVIANAKCNATVQLVDVTANPWAYYSCNPNTNRFVLATGSVSIAAGAGAGTGPTIALSAGSSGSQGTFTLTTGTAPSASAAIATVTLPAPDYGGGFSYAPTCTFTSIGSTAYTSGTASSTAGSGTSGGTAVLTASATALTASKSGYAWKYTCH